MNPRKGRKSIDGYLIVEYPVTIYCAPEGGFVAEIEDLPGCLSEGETLEEAFKNIVEARLAWITTAYIDGLEIPIPRTERQYSGKLLVRMGRTLHRRLAEHAVREGISLNQHVGTILSESVGYERGAEMGWKQTKLLPE